MSAGAVTIALTARLFFDLGCFALWDLDFDEEDFDEDDFGEDEDEVGLMLGDSVGDWVGLAVGDAVGDWVGLAVGDAVGDWVGLAVGDAVGDWVGLAVGDAVGDAVGLAVGDAVGDAVGLAVHSQGPFHVFDSEQITVPTKTSIPKVGRLELSMMTHAKLVQP